VIKGAGQCSYIGINQYPKKDNKIQNLKFENGKFLDMLFPARPYVFVAKSLKEKRIRILKQKPQITTA